MGQILSRPVAGARRQELRRYFEGAQRSALLAFHDLDRNSQFRPAAVKKLTAWVIA